MDATTLVRMAWMLEVKLIMVGLFSVEVRSKRLRSINISLYLAIAAAKAASCRPTLLGNTSYSFPRK
ncbi:hypothetical protein EVA_19530 [gut metagenome]|uniref:Uncharacterized protein n=1 Tax=gut metagenome TaxID=749906 RepID=J9FYB0_9ZZZZ